MYFFNHLSLFQSARIKLTLWYLLIIVIISGAFSFGLYKLMTAELDRIQKMQKVRIEYMEDPDEQNWPPAMHKPVPVIRFIDPEVIQESKNRIKFILFLINLGILTASTMAAYMLAGKTLRPIQEMVDEQNRFVTDASHELRTPLTALRAEMEVNLRDKKLSLKEAKEIIGSNLEEVISLQSLTDNLMRLTRGKKLKHQIKEVVSIREALEEAKKKVAPLAKQKEIELIIDKKDYQIVSQMQTLVELFVIFFDNAIKYSPAKTEIRVNSRKSDHTLRIDISDRGYGIDKEDLAHLFDRFYRGNKSRSKEQANGFGLGLSIAKQIVDGLDGSIKVKSEIGKGTTFSIFLPRTL